MNYYRQGPQRPSGIGVGIPPLTPYVKYLMIANGAVWLLQIVLLQSFEIRLHDYLGVIPEKVIRGWIWQPFTYMFLHDPRGVGHILLNMLMLWMFGGELERYWGGRAFLGYYVVCGVGGGIAATLWGLAVGQADHVTFGASGAIFGIFVAFGIAFAERTVLFMLFFPMKAKTMAWILVGINLFYLLSSSGGGVSHIGHLGGAVTGYLYLKRAWRVGDFYRELRWKVRRRKLKVMPPQDPDDRWLN